MGADHWSICPRCLDRAKDEAETRFQETVDAYGKVTAEEYERLRAEARQPFDEEKFRTFSEYYEFYGAEEGTITVDYGGECQKCGLAVNFRHEHKFYEGEDGDS